ncbi:HIT family protein [Chitinasiproducens palmae]|uniref:Diadenosine tetraphosphate (Ap4A) hydrolase n=1 Tax=Chitinasiproducens palmae TaxID=1770053 RepID=A0A1H2PPF7_9BURK|nr:HIT family protein [Chitinasiproducens palmae]SDV48175.1 Diadenosine tetraphosphate (Ap4A) hydrolase [Chitinasiproducens palmae]
MSGCPLCETDGGTVLWRGERLRVILADEPDYPGLCRVIWDAHVAEASDLPRDDQAHMLDVVMAVERAARAVMACDKINLAALGNMVPHLHWHVIPRYRDDRHFPQAIWAAPVRDVAPEILAARRARASDLRAAVVAELHEWR